MYKRSSLQQQRVWARDLTIRVFLTDNADLILGQFDTRRYTVSFMVNDTIQHDKSDFVSIFWYGNIGFFENKPTLIKGN